MAGGTTGSARAIAARRVACLPPHGKLVRPAAAGGVRRGTGAFAKKAVADYKRLRPVIQQGDLYRLVSPWDHSYASLMYVSDDKGKAVVFEPVAE